MSYFERLVASVERIAHHAYYPGKHDAVGLCMEDIDDLRLAGQISDEQAGLLREILLASFSHAA